MANNGNERPPQGQRPMPGFRGDGSGDGPNNPLSEANQPSVQPSARHGGGDCVLRPVLRDRPGNQQLNPPNAPNPQNASNQ